MIEMEKKNKNFQEFQEEFLETEEKSSKLKYESVNIDMIDTSQQDQSIIMTTACETKNKLVYLKMLDNSTKNFDFQEFKDKKIKDVKEFLFPDEFADSTKVIKFIFQGKLLSDQETIESYKVQPEQFIHCVISTISPKQDDVAVNMPSAQELNQDPNQNNQEALQQQLTQIINAYQAIQEQQNQNQNNNDQNNNAQLEEQLARHEDEQGTKLDFFIGIVFGSILAIFGVLIIFCFDFSYEAKKGVFVGLLINVLITLYKK